MIMNYEFVRFLNRSDVFLFHQRDSFEVGSIVDGALCFVILKVVLIPELKILALEYFDVFVGCQRALLSCVKIFTVIYC